MVKAAVVRRFISTLLLSALPCLAQEAPTEAPAAPETPPPEQKMSLLELTTSAEGAQVFIDGELVGQTPLPGPWTLPAGTHEIELRPVRGEPARATVEVEAGARARVTLLEHVPVAAPVEAPKEREVRVVHTGPGFSLATAGYVTAGVGVAAVGAGVAFGIIAQGAADDAAALDRRDAGNSRADLQALVDDVDGAAFAANLLYGVGAVAALAGVTMVVLASDGPLAPQRIEVRPTAGGAALGGTF